MLSLNPILREDYRSPTPRLERCCVYLFRWIGAPTPTPKEIHPLSASEARKLLEAAGGDRLEAFYMLAIYSGMRRGELRGLATMWGGSLYASSTVANQQEVMHGAPVSTEA
jgi:integrase